MNLKQQFKALFRGKALERPLFIPLLGTYLGKVSQKSMQELYTDPGLLHQGLRDAQQLLKADAVITPLDEALEAEALGCQVQWDEAGKRLEVKQSSGGQAPEPEMWIRMGRIPVFVEAVKRFAQVEGKQIPLIAAVTGPVTLTRLVYGESGQDKLGEVSQYVLQLIKAYAEAGADGILINEGLPLSTAADQQSWSADYKPLINVIRYYNRFALIRWVEPPPVTEQTAKINVHGLIAPEHSPPLNKKWIWGIPLNNGQLALISGKNSPQEINGIMYKQFFYTTATPLNHEENEVNVLLDNIRQLVIPST